MSGEDGQRRRIQRSLNQRICLLKDIGDHCYSVCSSRPNTTTRYSVKLSAIGLKHTCTCPDYERRKDNCKHIFFVLFRVLRVSQDKWLKDNSIITGRESRMLEEEDDECAICMEEFVKDSDRERDATIKCHECGHHFHAICIKQWFDANGKTRCPLCRSPM